MELKLFLNGLKYAYVDQFHYLDKDNRLAVCDIPEIN